MISWRTGVVEAVLRSWSGAREVSVVVPGAPAPVRALAYLPLVGAPEVGDRVLLNVTALAMGLGTGGFALVVALPDRLPPDPVAPAPPAGPGHLVKARYSPLQPVVLGVDEQDSPWHELLSSADSIEGMPVVVADLHSALPAIVAGIRSESASLRVGYVMTDGAALPVWFSRTVAALREASWLVGSVTVGQSFGGDLEAVTLHTGLLAARLVLSCDVVVVTQGPGNLGTDTRWGFSGVASGEAVNAVAALSGRPVAALRVSGADLRERHRGISHHSLTAYGRVALARADVVVPEVGGDLGAAVDAAAEPLGERHRLVRVSCEGLAQALATTPVRLSSMGRSYDQDPAYFLSSAAAGRYAASLAAPRL